MYACAIRHLAEAGLVERRHANPGARVTDENLSYVVKMPSREYTRSVYDGALADGSMQRLDPVLRREINAYYTQIDDMRAYTRQNDDTHHELSASRDPCRSTRASAIRCFTCLTSFAAASSLWTRYQVSWSITCRKCAWFRRLGR